MLTSNLDVYYDVGATSYGTAFQTRHAAGCMPDFRHRRRLGWATERVADVQGAGGRSISVFLIAIVNLIGDWA